MSKITEYSLCALSTYCLLVLTVLEQIKILIYDIYLTKRLCQDQCSFLYTGLQIYVKMRQASIILFFFNLQLRLPKFTLVFHQKYNGQYFYIITRN